MLNCYEKPFLSFLKQSEVVNDLLTNYEKPLPSNGFPSIVLFLYGIYYTATIPKVLTSKIVA